MNEQECKDRVAELTREELLQPEVWHYLSFAEEHQFNGAVIIQGHGITDCLSRCNRLQINPHGEVLAVVIPDEMLPPEEFRNRLLSKEEVVKCWPDAKSLREFEQEIECE
jgi:hypothetical protein